jgi:PilZ domain-containing protein
MSSERRVTPRFKLRTPLSFHRMESLADGEQQSKAINISSRGVYFVTSVGLSIGEAVEVLLEIPERVTGAKALIRRFTGRVTHIESKGMLAGHSGIGVQLLYYERDLAKANLTEPWPAWD